MNWMYWPKSRNGITPKFVVIGKKPVSDSVNVSRRASGFRSSVAANACSVANARNASSPVHPSARRRRVRLMFSNCSAMRFGTPEPSASSIAPDPAVPSEVVVSFVTRRSAPFSSRRRDLVGRLVAVAVISDEHPLSVDVAVEVVDDVDRQLVSVPVEHLLPSRRPMKRCPNFRAIFTWWRLQKVVRSRSLEAVRR